jgi:hypothetical protein
MPEQIRVNTAVLLRFYARNRLLHVIALIFALLAGITVSFSLAYGSSAGRFSIIADSMSTLNGFAFVLSGFLGLFAISSHLRQRNLKMILTKPCLPEVWIGSVFLSGLVVATLLHLVTILYGVSLSLLWGVPIQTGLFFLAAESLLRSAVLLGYLSFLSMLMHPVLAILIALLFNEGTFYSIRFMLLTGIRTTGGNPLLPVLEKGTYLLYLLLPAYKPYEELTGPVESSLRVGAAEWLALARIAGYAGTTLGLFFLLAVWGLSRRNLA